MKKLSLLSAFFFLALVQTLFGQASGVNPELIMYRHNSMPGLSPTSVVQGNVLGTLKWNGLTAINAIRTGAQCCGTGCTKGRRGGDGTAGGLG